MPSNPPNQLMITATQFHEAEKFSEAETLYRKLLADNPARIDARCGLGLLLGQIGRHEEARKWLDWEVVWQTNSALLLTALGAALLATDEAEKAEQCARRAAQIDGSFVQAMNLLGCALLARGRDVEAVTELRRAVEMNGHYVDARYNLGCALSKMGMQAEAAACFHETVAMNPRHAAAWLNLGLELRKAGELDAAMVTFARAIEARPGLSQAMHNLGAVLAEKGRVHEGIEWIRKALQANPANHYAHSALIYLMNFDPAFDTSDMAQEAARWHDHHAAALLPAAATHANDRSPDRRLKIGYVSPDFRRHAESWFLVPLFEAHDRNAFEIHAYSSVRKPDEVTAKIRGLVDVWHDVKDLSDAALADAIRHDGIDILVDLTMHLDDGRLPTFARKPAPVQIAWLAYPGGTGLKAMDYRISDPVLDPIFEEDDWPEKTLRLDGTWFCFKPWDQAPAVAPLPAANSEYFTFGSLNTFRKMSEEVLELWAQVIAEAGVRNRAPGGNGKKVRLFMTCPKGSHQKAVRGLFARHGVVDEQLELVEPMSYADYINTYQHIDIALDPYPHNGATTTCEALWMGVPVLTIRGKTGPGRLGASILHTLKMPEWIAASREEFVEKAISLSRDLETLATTRRNLRDRLAISALLEAKSFARKMETAYREAWRTSCAR